MSRVGPPGDDTSDEALVAAAREGNVRALEGLVVRHESRVLRVLRYLGVRPEDREDLAQDVFIRVFRGLPTYKTGAIFEAWLYRVTVNVALDYREGEARTARLMGPMPDDEPGTRESPPAAADPTLLRVRLEAALGALSPRERAVFVLKEIEGLDTAEVARALGLSGITVRRHLGLARERLKKLLVSS